METNNFVRAFKIFMKYNFCAFICSLHGDDAFLEEDLQYPISPSLPNLDAMLQQLAFVDPFGAFLRIGDTAQIVEQ